MLNKNLKLLALFAFVAVLGTASAFANDAVFNPSEEVQEINLKPVVNEVKESQTSAPKAETPAVSTEKKAGETLSEENFKSAITNLDAAQVDVREQLATYSTLVAQKQAEVNAKKAELSALKKKYSELQKKTKSIDKMKKMLNEHVAQ